MNIYRKTKKQIRRICERLCHAYSDDRLFALCKARLLDIAYEMESYEPAAVSFEVNSENVDE